MVPIPKYEFYNVYMFICSELKTKNSDLNELHFEINA